MAYTDYEEVIQRYPVLSTWGQQGESEVNSALIYFAEMELNSRLGTHFSVPFSAAHPTVKDLAIDLTYYRVLRGKDPEKAEAFKDSIIGRIEGIKEGKEFIFTTSGTVLMPESQGSEGEPWSTTIDYHPVHSMLDPEHYATAISSEMLDAEEDARGW